MRPVLLATSPASSGGESVADEPPPGSHRRVATVADTGLGIAPEHRPYIFNSFQAIKPSDIGTAPGLSIRFTIVR